MQTARHSLGQHVVPHPPGAVSPIAGKEAGANLHAEFFIAPAAPTAISGPVRPHAPPIVTREQIPRSAGNSDRCAPKLWSKVASKFGIHTNSGESGCYWLARCPK